MDRRLDGIDRAIVEMQEAIPKIVRTVTGLPTYLVMAAVRLDDQMAPEMVASLFDEVDRLTETNDADSALWYELEPAGLRPREPRWDWLVEIGHPVDLWP